MELEWHSDSSMSSNSNIISNNQRMKENYSSTSTWSKYRGVIWLKSGKWGARIAFRYKAYWLGTYDTEEEAGMAYDRACIKLQRSDAPLNFPMHMYSVQETKFQSHYSNEDILDMIKDKSYLSKFEKYIADQSLVSELGGMAQRGLSYRMLFRKELTQTDATHIKGFHIPKEYAIEYFPPLSAGDENENKSIELTFYDKHSCPWTFRYSYWKSTQTFVFTKGWRHFLKMNNLKPKDCVFFYRCEHQKESQGRGFYYMIDAQRVSVDGDSGNVDKARQLMRKKLNNEELVEDMEEEKTSNNNGVMLFGVQIGKTSEYKQFI
ncbi:hypothetical protein JCGZ_03455 [Jatropha curcas]|uniref:Uncharacterized protein n=1 Tax=Jatropha curcas TaxID=180498 RepID=A0A067L738_JATCU|nr:AP2/ERF and B3 domain-containing transcription factor At1g50680 [Jatropha curcas]KDP39924.1 hypothetical protein JCGZ_03455 [Jatropha curcas]